MNNNFRNAAGAYAAEVQVAYVRAGLFGWLVALGWLAFPFGLQTMLHPGDAIRLQYKLQGLHAPHLFTAQQLSVGFIEAAVALAVLVMFQMVCTVLFYRRAQLDGVKLAAPALCPLATVLAGIIGNAAWFVGTGAFDVQGCVVGLSSAALTVGAELLVENLGRDFVLGSAASNQHLPQPQSW